MNDVLSDSFVSFLIFTNAMEFRWCGRPVMNYMENFMAKVSKVSIMCCGSLVNQLSGENPTKDNTTHSI